MKTKFRTYALFQFMTFIALLSLAIAAILAMYDGDQHKLSISSSSFWSTRLSANLKFESTTAIGTASSVFMYTTMGLWLSSWLMGGMIMAAKQKNLFDNLFTFFFFIPLISNMFALVAQFSLNSTEYADAKINKHEIIKQAERELRTELKDEAHQLEEIRKDLGNTSEIKTAKSVAKKTPAKKATVKKAPAKKPVAKKTPAKKATVKKTTTKKPAAKKAPVKKSKK